MRYCLALLLALCCITLLGRPARSEEVLKTTVCEVLSNPSAYNHKLIELTGEAAERSEYFSLSDDSCYPIERNITGIWLEYGGLRRSGVKYCCNSSTDRTSPSNLVIDGITTTLHDDSRFRSFDAAVYPGGEAQATLVGRFFCGERQTLPKGKYFWGGYGHLGMYSLLVIEQVLSVQRRSHAD